ncbi:MAG: alpha-glucosidase/alpha-galactosidase [Oscillospiraceae bacterium]|nr:alpha-glucosidase/alpha-galactosidase [Oscillospiraceae bacterium]
MPKLTFLGAGSSVFAKNVLGDCLLTDAIRSDFDIALYDIDKDRLSESFELVSALNNKYNDGKARIKTYLGVENRREALRGADFAVNAIQVGGYEPSTIIDFEIPKKYGLLQTIGDTLGIGGIFRALRTIPVMRDFAEDMEAVCPNVWLLNYTNPMAMLAGFMQRYTRVKTIGLCHSVQVCAPRLLEALGIDAPGYSEKIAGINHMGWLLEIRDKDGNDLYPKIRELAAKKNAEEKHDDMVRYEYIRRLGYYCTESSEHNSEYNPWFIKPNYPELIDKYNIPLDEYPRRCIRNIESWGEVKATLYKDGELVHNRSNEYASRIIEAMLTNIPYKLGGNVLNRGLITNLPENACVEVPCMVDNSGINPTLIGELPLQLAAMNMTNINPQLLTIKAAVTRKREAIYHAAMLDPHTAAVLSLDDIVSMCDEMILAHAKSGYPVI